MKNTYGSSITLTLFGESHGEAIGAVLDGLCPGLDVDNEYIASLLSKRRPSSAADTSRREPDHFRIVYLPRETVLKESMIKMRDFLSTYHQN